MGHCPLRPATASRQAYALLGDPAQAEDATQKSFIKAFQAMNTFRGVSLRSWLLHIVTNSAYDLMRRAQRHPTQALYTEDENGEEVESAAWLVDQSSDVQNMEEEHELSNPFLWRCICDIYIRGESKLPHQWGSWGLVRWTGL